MTRSELRAIIIEELNKRTPITEGRFFERLFTGVIDAYKKALDTGLDAQVKAKLSKDPKYIAAQNKMESAMQTILDIAEELHINTNER